MAPCHPWDYTRNLPTESCALLCQKSERFRSTENTGCLLFCNVLALSVASLQHSPSLFGWQASSLGFGPPLPFCLTIILIFMSLYEYLNFFAFPKFSQRFLLCCCVALFRCVTLPWYSILIAYCRAVGCARLEPVGPSHLCYSGWQYSGR